MRGALEISTLASMARSPWYILIDYYLFIAMALEHRR